jgi:conjugal transfer ATP-binding protein TraC
MVFEKIMDTYHRFSEKFAKLVGENTGIEGSTQQAIKIAREVMEVPYAALREALPYDLYDAENSLFINKNSVGFAYSVLPLTGADEGIVRAIAQLIKDKLPAGWDCQGALFKHSMIADKLVSLYEPFFKKGGMYARLAEMGVQYHLNASKKGYKNKRGYPCRLSDYRVYLSFSKPKRIFEDFENELQVRADIEAELKICKFIFNRLDDRELATYVRSLVSFIDNKQTFDQFDIDELSPLSYSIPRRGTTLIVDDNAIHGRVYDDEDKETKTEIVNLTIKKWPDFYALWNGADNYANLKQSEKGIQSTFLLTFNIRGLSHESQKLIEARKARSLTQRNNHVYRQLIPGIENQAADHDYVHKNMVKDKITTCDVSFNLILFSTPEKVRADIAKAKGTFRHNQIELTPAFGSQWLSFLSSLPFFMSEGIYQSLKAMGQVKPLTNWNAANFLPVIGEFQGCNSGVIMPTLRNQLCALDWHDYKFLPITNFNVSIKASPGAGKSFLSNTFVTSEMAQGNKMFIIDVGDSYKHLASIFDGVYIDANNLKLNPFTLFDFEGKSIIKNDDGDLIEIDSSEQIRDLLALMASPDEPLEPVCRAYLLKAVNSAWAKFKKEALIDDVINELGVLLENKYQGDQRIRDLMTLLEQYSSGGEYGKYFNSKTPLFNNNQLVVLELGGLKDKKQLLQVVMYALIVVIQGQFYNTPRHIKKRCIIDEAWQFLAKGSNPIASEFIEKGFRTARKHNGGFTVIVHKLDELKVSDVGRAIESCSDIEIIMRQSGLDTYIENYPNAFNEFQEDMIRRFGAAKENGFSEMMMKFGGSVSFHRLFNDPFSRILYSTAGNEFQAVEDLVAKGVSTVDAVEMVAKKFYGDEL